MQREDKAIDVLKNTTKIRYVLGSAEYLVDIKKERPDVPFSDHTIQFLGELSDRLLKNPQARNYPEVTAFAFWCRMAHLQSMKVEYGFSERAKNSRLGRGVSLHFAPSNMPVLFAFSLVAGLLAGNSVILRLPQKETDQEQLILCEIRDLLEQKFSMFLNRIILCRYEHDREVTDALSALCDVRVMWGSDQAIEEIRRSPLPSRAIELPFASRGSVAILSAREILLTDEIDLLAHQFYNDTYLNDQNACSSPHMIYWMGTAEEVHAAKDRFWSAVCTLLDEKQYQVPATLAVEKLDHALVLAATFKGTRICREKNRLVRVQVDGFQEDMWENTAPGGFFLESEGETLSGIEKVLTSHCQTVCTYGVDQKELAEELIKLRIAGADRIVPVGQALEFSLTWDGFDLINTMSRRIQIF